MNRWRSFWAWLRPATPEDPRPGHDRQWAEDMPHLLNRFNEPELSEQDRQAIAREIGEDRTRDAGGLE